MQATQRRSAQRSSVLVTFGAALVGVIFLTASPAAAARPATGLAPTCLRDAARTSACTLVYDYFAALNSGDYEKACSLLGR